MLVVEQTRNELRKRIRRYFTAEYLCYSHARTSRRVDNDTIDMEIFEIAKNKSQQRFDRDSWSRFHGLVRVFNFESKHRFRSSIDFTAVLSSRCIRPALDKLSTQLKRTRNTREPAIIHERVIHDYSIRELLHFFIIQKKKNGKMEPL